MKYEFVFEDWFNDDWYHTEQGDVRFIHIWGMEIQLSGKSVGCGKCRACWVFFGGIFIGFAGVIGVIGACAAPIIIAVCY